METTFWESLTWKKGCLGIILLIVIGNVLFFIIGAVAWESDYRDAVDLENQCHVACEQNDYEKAHNLLLQLKETEENYKYKETKKYVYNHEALFLMSMGDDTAKKRIVYLLKEEGGNDELVTMLIDLAIENDDAAFVKKLLMQYKEGSEYEDVEKLMKFFIEKQDEEYILKLLTEIENEIPNRPEIGVVRGGYYQGLNEDQEQYIKCVKNFNSACRTILNAAISANNQKLAKLIVKKAKTNLSATYLGDWTNVVEKRKDVSGGIAAIKLVLDNSDANSIRAAYQEAVSNGAFK